MLNTIEISFVVSLVVTMSLFLLIENENKTQKNPRNFLKSHKSICLNLDLLHSKNQVLSSM